MRFGKSSSCRHGAAHLVLMDADETVIRDKTTAFRSISRDNSCRIVVLSSDCSGGFERNSGQVKRELDCNVAGCNVPEKLNKVRLCEAL